MSYLKGLLLVGAAFLFVGCSHNTYNNEIHDKSIVIENSINENKGLYIELPSIRTETSSSQTLINLSKYDKPIYELNGTYTKVTAYEVVEEEKVTYLVLSKIPSCSGKDRKVIQNLDIVLELDYVKEIVFNESGNPKTISDTKKYGNAIESSACLTKDRELIINTVKEYRELLEVKRFYLN